MTNRREFLGVAAALLTSSRPGRASGKPKQILLMRHGEKSGSKDDPDLNKQGYLRAAALLRLFPGSFDTPEFLFASKASRRSNREIETLTPLARALHLQINGVYTDEEYPALASELLSNPRYSEKTLLVCWHHGNIPQFAARLGVAKPPSPWPDTQFDRIWKIQYPDGGVSMTDLPQHLLDSDS
jgi:phosphohistidine phosphatase SixA